MKKRYLILAGMLMAAQVLNAVPSIAEDAEAIVEEIEESTEESAEEASSEALMEELEEAEIEEVMDAEDEDVLMDYEEEEEKVRPEYDFHEYLKELGAYKDLTVEVEPLEEVTDDIVMEEIDFRMEDIRDEITEGTVEMGDIANIDYEGKKDGVAFDGGTAKGYDLEIGSGSFIEGFEDGLVGVKIGDTVDLNLTFPEGYPAADLAGAEVVFTVTVHSVQRAAEFSDEAAEKLSDGECKDMDSYKAFVKEELENENKENQKKEAENLLWNLVMESTVIETLPEDVVEFDLEDSMSYYEMMVYYYMGTSLEDYCSMQGITIDDYKADMRESAEIGIRYEIIERAIVEAEGITFTEEDFNNCAAEYAAENGYDLETFLELATESQIWEYMYYKNAAEILMSNNTYTEKAAE